MAFWYLQPIVNLLIIQHTYLAIFHQFMEHDEHSRGSAALGFIYCIAAFEYFLDHCSIYRSLWYHNVITSGILYSLSSEAYPSFRILVTWNNTMPFWYSIACKVSALFEGSRAQLPAWIHEKPSSLAELQMPNEYHCYSFAQSTSDWFAYTAPRSYVHELKVPLKSPWSQNRLWQKGFSSSCPQYILGVASPVLISIE